LVCEHLNVAATILLCQLRQTPPLSLPGQLQINRRQEALLFVCVLLYARAGRHLDKGVPADLEMKKKERKSQEARVHLSMRYTKELRAKK